MQATLLCVCEVTTFSPHLWTLGLDLLGKNKNHRQWTQDPWIFDCLILWLTKLLSFKEELHLLPYVG